jgi:hypothetical protein
MAALPAGTLPACHSDYRDTPRAEISKLGGSLSKWKHNEEMSLGATHRFGRSWNVSVTMLESSRSRLTASGAVIGRG